MTGQLMEGIQRLVEVPSTLEEGSNSAGSAFEALGGCSGRADQAERLQRRSRRIFGWARCRASSSCFERRQHNRLPILY